MMEHSAGKLTGFLASLSDRGRLTRTELYDAVWRSPIEDLAPHLAISGRGLGKLCDRFDIPRPSRGQWQKMAAGKRVRKPKLPVSEALSSDLAVITRGSIDARRREQASSGSEDPIVKFWQSEMARQRRARRVVPTLKSSAAAAKWLSRNQGGHWSAQPNIDIDPKSRKAAEKRLASLVPRLLAEAERLGATLSRDSTERSLNLQHAAGELRCDVMLDVRQYRRALTEQERSERFRDPASTWTQVKQASGGICVKLHGFLPSSIPQRWADTAEQPSVEARLPEIVATIATAFEEQRRRALERLAQADRARAREQERARRLALEEERKARRGRLVAAARAYRDAQDLQAFILAVRERARQAGLIGYLSEWEVWAGQIVTELDPIGSDAALGAIMADHTAELSG